MMTSSHNFLPIILAKYLEKQALSEYYSNEFDEKWFY